MSSMNIRKGDLVLVTAGKSSDKGKKARVLETSPKNGTVIVEGINMQKHHKKPRSAKAAGGITEIAGPIDVSNVMLVCPNSDCPKSIHGARAKHILNEKGKSVRVCCKCGASLEPPKVDSYYITRSPSTVPADLEEELLADRSYGLQGDDHGRHDDDGQENIK